MPFTATALAGGIQHVAASTPCCVPAVPVRVIGSRKQLRKSPLQI
jgi:hypothetical protein